MLGRAILKHPAPRLCDIILQEKEMNTARIDFVDARLSRQNGLHQGLPVEIPLAHVADADYGDYWSGKVDLAATAAPNGSKNWKKEGRYTVNCVWRVSSTGTHQARNSR